MEGYRKRLLAMCRRGEKIGAGDRFLRRAAKSRRKKNETKRYDARRKSAHIFFEINDNNVCYHSYLYFMEVCVCKAVSCRRRI